METLRSSSANISIWGRASRQLHISSAILSLFLQKPLSNKKTSISTPRPTKPQNQNPATTWFPYPSTHLLRPYLAPFWKRFRCGLASAGSVRVVSTSSSFFHTLNRQQRVLPYHQNWAREKKNNYNSTRLRKVCVSDRRPGVFSISWPSHIHTNTESFFWS